jgi:hypothetical protein
MVYQCELNKKIEMELYGKLRYIGRDFPISLTNGKVYDCVGVDNGMIRIVDDEEEDYLYPTSNPKPADIHDYEGGKWEIVEIYNDELEKELRLYAEK